MSQNFLYNASFHSLLNTIDQELAEQTKEKGCSYCGKQLHQADYPRSPFGLPAQFRTAYEERFSFCCTDCRKRTTPASVRFRCFARCLREESYPQSMPLSSKKHIK